MASFALGRKLFLQAAIEDAIHRHGMNEEGARVAGGLIEHF